MKKYSLILPISILLLGLASCKKSYKCTCTSDIDGSITNISDYKLTKPDAESACGNADDVVNVSCVLTN